MTSTTQKTNFANRFARASGLIYTAIYMMAAAWAGTQICRPAAQLLNCFASRRF